MALQCSTAVANARLDAIESAIGPSPLFRLYTSTIPADCATALSGNTMISETTCPSDWLSSAAAGSKAAPAWPSTAAVAAGTATFFRIYDASGVTCHMQGSVSTIGGGGSLQFASVVFAVGDGVAVGGFILRAPEAPAFQGSLAQTLGAATLSAAGTVVNPSWTSTRFNQTQYTNQWVYRSSSAPSTGFLVTMWIKCPTAISSYPTDRGNQEFLRIDFGNWYVRAICLNGSTTGASAAVAQNNTMLFADGSSVSESADSWANDFSYWTDSGMPVANVNGWVFCAVQASIDGSSNITLRQWIRYGSGSMSAVHADTISLATLRADLVANAGWTSPHANSYTPNTTLVGVRLNGDNGSDLYLHEVRVYDQATEPSGSTLNAIADSHAADTGAWADWKLEWVSGAATLTDRSGNGRGLTSMGGSLSAGGAFP